MVFREVEVTQWNHKQPVGRRSPRPTYWRMHHGFRSEVLEHLAAPPVKPGKKDLVLLPSHLWLTIHESIGHSTELDRALGYEANYAGTSFLTTEKMGNFRVGSELINVFGDRMNERGLATVKYDDDGVLTTKFPIIEKGVFKHYQTIRDQAHLVGETESRGCCYADAWSSVPFQRMPNVWLAPGKETVTPEDLISGVDDGILIEGNGSFSIDQQRYNFQFGGDAFWEIKAARRAVWFRASPIRRARPTSGTLAMASPDRVTGSSLARRTTARANRRRVIQSARLLTFPFPSNQRAIDRLKETAC